MKNLTDQAVIDIAIGLIAKNGKTTTLEVKKALRDDDFFATQTEVSVLMDSLYYQNGMEFANNGNYREYFLTGAAPAPVTPSRSVTFTIVKTPKVAAVSVLNPTTNDWKVTDLNNLIVAHYSGISSRGVVRSAFTKTYNANYLDTRATRVK